MEERKGENTTVFLEGGPFYTGDIPCGSSQSDAVSRFFDYYDNFSVVGINRTGNVSICSQPTVARQPGETGHTRGYQLGNAQNVCIQNITFDAKGCDMDPQSGNIGARNSPDGDSRYVRGGRNLLPAAIGRDPGENAQHRKRQYEWLTFMV